VKEKLRQIYVERQFNPQWLGIFINPFFLARRGLRRAIEARKGYLYGKMLDVGCGSKPYRALFAVDDYVGLEIDTPQTRARGIADVWYDGKKFPFGDESFDSVLCNQVLEHIFTPDEFLREIHRVLKPGGHLLLTVPFVWDEHEQPYDYARYSSFGLRALLEKNNFVVREHEKILNDASVLFQLLIAYLYKIIGIRDVKFSLLLSVVLFAPISLAGWCAGVLLPKNNDLFLDQIILAERHRS
jgi:SAM-dependent methyltransferase